MKKIVTLFVVLALFSVGCEAFKSSYDNMPQTVNTPEADGNKVPDGSGSKFVCEAVEGVTVAKSEESGAVTETILASAAEGATIAATAEKLADNATKISITSNDELVIAFVISKGDNDEFSVCSIEGKSEAVKSGSITVDSFNEGDDVAKSINAGTFKIEFEAATDAASVMKAAASEDAAAANVIEGSYFTAGLTVAEAKK